DCEFAANLRWTAQQVTRGAGYDTRGSREGKAGQMPSLLGTRTERLVHMLVMVVRVLQVSHRDGRFARPTVRLMVEPRIVVGVIAGPIILRRSGVVVRTVLVEHIALPVRPIAPIVTAGPVVVVLVMAAVPVMMIVTSAIVMVWAAIGDVPIVVVVM